MVKVKRIRDKIIILKLVLVKEILYKVYTSDLK